MASEPKGRATGGGGGAEEAATPGATQAACNIGAVAAGGTEPRSSCNQGTPTPART